MENGGEQLRDLVCGAAMWGMVLNLGGDPKKAACPSIALWQEAAPTRRGVRPSPECYLLEMRGGEFH